MPGAEIGTAKLGVTLLLGGVLDSFLPELHVNLTLKNTDELEDYFTTPDVNKLLNWLLGWLLPAEYDYKINVLLAIDTTFLIAETDSGFSPRLGYTTALTI